MVKFNLVQLKQCENGDSLSYTATSTSGGDLSLVGELLSRADERSQHVAKLKIVRLKEVLKTGTTFTASSKSWPGPMKALPRRARK